MRKQHWPKRDPIKNYFPLPNEIFSLGLSAGAIAVYGFLLHREDRRTYQCVASYRTIGEAVGMSVNTVRKYVTELEDRGLIRTERTTVTTRDGRTLNGCLRYYILPIQMSIEQFYERQLHAADLALERQRSEQRLAALKRKECASGSDADDRLHDRAGSVSVSAAHHRHAAVHRQQVELYARESYRRRCGSPVPLR